MKTAYDKSIDAAEESAKESKVVKEYIQESIHSDFKDTFKIGFWEKWFYYKPIWMWTKFRWWLRCKIEKFRFGFPKFHASDFFSAHAEWVLPRLKKLNEIKMSFPSSIDDIEDGEKPDKDYLARKDEEWTKIIDKIIWSFEHLCDEPDIIYPDDYDHSVLVKEYENGSREYIKQDKREPDFSAIHEHRRKIQEGLDLFAKYYTDLWS